MAIGALDYYSKTSFNSLSVIPNKPAHGFKSLHHVQVRIQIKRYDLVFGGLCLVKRHLFSCVSERNDL